MRIVVFLLLGLGWPLGVWAQRTRPNRTLDVPLRLDSQQAWLRRPGRPDTTRVKLLLNCGGLLLNSRTDSAVWYYEQGLALARRNRYAWGEMVAQNHLGAVYYYTSNYPAAQRAFERSLRLARQLRSFDILGHAYLGLGNVATELHDAPAAQAYFAQARRAYAAMRPRFVNGELLVLYNRANGYLDAREPARARTLVQEQLALLRRFPRQASRAKLLGQLGTVQLAQHQPDSAVASWQLAIGAARTEQNTQAEGESWQNLAELALTRAAYPEALAHARQAARAFRALGDAEPLAAALLAQARALAALRQPGAYDTLLRASTLRDTLYNQQRLQAVADAQARFSQVEQQARIRELEQQRRIASLEATQRSFRNQVALATLAGLALLLAALGWSFYRRRQVAREVALRTRLASDLHDDVGTLLTQISLESALLEEGQYTPAQQHTRLRRVAEVSRNAARQMSDVVWSVDARNDSFASLLDRMHDHAQEVLATADIEVEFSIDPALRTQPLPLLARQSLYLIFKEALHNVLKHAQATEVRISLQPADGWLRLQVRDNGQGGPIAESRASHGLRNMRMRAEAVGGTVRYESTATGFAVVAELPA